VRSDLKSAGVTNVETDLDEMTCSFDLDSTVDVSEFLNSLAKDNNKLAEWTFLKE